MMRKALVALCAAVLVGATRAAAPKAGDNVVLIGDSITEMAACESWGFYHVLTNAAGKAAAAGGAKVNFYPLGYGGNRLCDWRPIS